MSALCANSPRKARMAGLGKPPDKTRNHIPKGLPVALLATFLAASSALHADSTQNKLPFPMPDFMSQSQVVAWQKDRIAKADAARASQAAASRPSTIDSSTSSLNSGVPTPLAPPQGSGAARSSQSNQLPPVAGFYTGKPYLAESGSYAFKYREYNPETARWTTVDPSGFPDGANNRLYAAVPTSQFDSNGFWITAVYSITKQTFTIDNQVFGGCNSGDNNVDHQSSQYAYVGPLPTGEYNIFDRPGGIGGHSAFILDPIDSVTQNDHWDSGVGQGRGNFRLHINGTTEGCIATSSIDQIANIIYSSAGSSMEYTINTGDGVTFNTPLYGKLTVVE